MKVHELINELAACVAGAEVHICIGGEMYDVDSVTCANHDGAMCFVSGKRAYVLDDYEPLRINKSDLAEVAEQLGGGDYSITIPVSVCGCRD
ncbi:hypothetical protein [Senegalimassilia anaerobia]